MKNMKKYIVASLAACVTLSPMATIAVDGPDSPVSNEVKPIYAPIYDRGDTVDGIDIIDPVDIIDEVQIPDYIEYKGKIAEIDKSGNTFRILVKDNLDEPFNGMLLYINENVILLDGETKDFITTDELEVGMPVTTYYHKETIMLMSMPPQLAPDVIVVNASEEYSSIHISNFDENLLSSDGGLILTISNDTIIVDKEGNKVDKEEIKNRDLVVFYSIVRESYPAQTTPEKIVVIENKEYVVEDSVLEHENAVSELGIKILNKIYINDEEISLENEIFENQAGIKMLPLRQIAEALGYEVTWDNEAKRAELVKGAHYTAVTIGEDNYNFARMLVSLGTAPVLKDSRTFVPYDFLQEVLKVNVEIIDGVINILE